MYKLFLTIRYVFKPLSLVTIVALAFSHIIYPAAPSVMNGFQEDFHARIRGTMSDMSLRSDRPLDVPYLETIEKSLESVPGVKAVAPFIEHPALDRHVNKIDYCLIHGIEPRREEKVSEFRQFILPLRDWVLAREDWDIATPQKKKIIEGYARIYPGSVEQSKLELAQAQQALAAAKARSAGAEEIKSGEAAVEQAQRALDFAEHQVDKIYDWLENGYPDPNDPKKRIPAVLAGLFFMKIYDLDIESVVKLTTAAGEGTEVQQDKQFVIVGAFRAGSHDTDRRTLYMSLKTAQSFIGTQRISGYAIKLDDFNEARVVRRKALEAVEALRGKTGHLAQPLAAGGTEVDLGSFAPECDPKKTGATAIEFRSTGGELLEALPIQAVAGNVAVLSSAATMDHTVAETVRVRLDYNPRHLWVKTWEEQNENLLKAVGMERLLIKLITGMIVVAASASIFLVLFMSVQNKVRELGILRAVGGSNLGALQIFLGQGMLLGIIGMLLGSALGLLGAHYINELANFIHMLTGWHPFPPEVYYLEKIPSKIYWSELATNAVITLILGFGAATLPAIIAAFRPPIRAIRHD